MLFDDQHYKYTLWIEIYKIQLGDPECKSVISRSMFIEVLSSLDKVSLTEDEKQEVTTFFSSNDMSVHYLTFLHDVLPNKEIPPASASVSRVEDSNLNVGEDVTMLD